MLTGSRNSLVAICEANDCKTLGNTEDVGLVLAESCRREKAILLHV